VKLGRVVGTVVSTINVPAFDGRTLLLCDLLDPSGRAAGGYLIAVDTVGAGAGETVLILDEGNSARQVLAAPAAPIRTLVVGIVDTVTDRSAVVTLGEERAVPASAVATPRDARPTITAARAPARPGRPR
jgi:ethanolamine utilization protein EutN